MAGNLRELRMQFHSDPAANQHDHQTVTPDLFDRVHSLGAYKLPGCESAVEVDRYHLEKRQNPSLIFCPRCRVRPASMRSPWAAHTAGSGPLRSRILANRLGGATAGMCNTTMTT